MLLAFAVARLFPGVKSNSLEPGWVPTKMKEVAPDDIDKAHRMQVWWRRATNRLRQFPEVFLSPESSGSGSDYKKCRTTDFAARLVSYGFGYGSS